MLPTSSCSGIQGPALVMENVWARRSPGSRVRAQNPAPGPRTRTGRRDQVWGKAPSLPRGQGRALLPNPPPHFGLQPLATRPLEERGTPFLGKKGRARAKPGEGAGPGGRRFPGSGRLACATRWQSAGTTALNPCLRQPTRRKVGNSKKPTPSKDALGNPGRTQSANQPTRDTTSTPSTKQTFFPRRLTIVLDSGLL